MPKKRKRKISKKQQKSYSAGWNPDISFNIDPDTLCEIIAIILIAVAGITILSLFGLASKLGQAWLHLLKTSIGLSCIFLPFIFLGLAIVLFYHQKYKVKLLNLLGILLFIASFSGLFHLLLVHPENSLAAAFKGSGGGFLGYALTSPAYNIIGPIALFILSLAFLIISILMIFNTSLKSIKDKIVNLKEKREEKPPAERKTLLKKRVQVHEAVPKKSVKEAFLKRSGLKPSDSTKSRQQITKDGTWQFPSLNLLKESTSRAESGDIKRNAEIIRKTLGHFDIEVEMGEVNVGPTVTQYTLKPATGIKLNRITALSNDLALALAAHPIRIEAPIPGKSLLGIEIPNKVPALVSLKDTIESPEFQNSRSNLTLVIGRNVAGKPIVDDLSKMPHLLIAGATGSGKTVCLNSVITSLLYKNSPDKLKLILIDPKRVEFTYYNDIPHLITPVVVDPIKTVSALKWALTEMDRRYKLFEEVGKQNIIAYNKTFKDKQLPYIATIIDELADLMMVSPQEVEGAIVRLSQMARATGIHLIISTQRPSVNVITGLIKANIIYRIAFATASQVDSRTILDMAGAEKLLGSGDMLYLAGNTSRPRRLQGSFISEAEIRKVSDFLKKQGKPEYNDEVTNLAVKSSSAAFGQIPEDEFFDQALEVVTSTGRASASLLQRRLKIGYARAARLLDLLEENSIVGPAEGSKPREILVDSLEEALKLKNGELTNHDSADDESMISYDSDNLNNHES
jgi:DNA segregation ATPase FtsK/SpoIIIE, S-DNA-T family